MSSASAVIGPLAASATIFARTRAAFATVMTFSRAAGTRMSQSRKRTSSLAGRFVAPG